MRRPSRTPTATPRSSPRRAAARLPTRVRPCGCSRPARGSRLPRSRCQSRSSPARRRHCIRPQRSRQAVIVHPVVGFQRKMKLLGLITLLLLVPASSASADRGHCRSVRSSPATIRALPRSAGSPGRRCLKRAAQQLQLQADLSAAWGVSVDAPRDSRFGQHHCHAADSDQGSADRRDRRLHSIRRGRSGEDGSGEFTFYPRATTHSGLRAELGRHPHGEEPGAREHLRVPVLTLSSLIDVHSIEHVDLLKIDAEWAEESILRGIAERHWRRTDQVVVEVHGGGCAIDAYLTERNLIVAREDDAATGHAIVYARRDDGAQQGTSVRAYHVRCPEGKRESPPDLKSRAYPGVEPSDVERSIHAGHGTRSQGRSEGAYKAGGADVSRGTGDRPGGASGGGSRSRQ
jgi:FkbM family methyltransferase